MNVVKDLGVLTPVYYFSLSFCRAVFVEAIKEWQKSGEEVLLRVCVQKEKAIVVLILFFAGILMFR